MRETDSTSPAVSVVTKACDNEPSRARFFQSLIASGPLINTNWEIGNHSSKAIVQKIVWRPTRAKGVLSVFDVFFVFRFFVLKKQNFSRSSLTIYNTRYATKTIMGETSAAHAQRGCQRRSHTFCFSCCEWICDFMRTWKSYLQKIFRFSSDSVPSCRWTSLFLY